MPQRSAFVDIVGWVFVVLAGFGVSIGILQNFMVHLFFTPEFHEQMAQNAGDFGPAFQFFKYIKLIMAAVLALMVVTLAAAIGLLRRHNWARLAFIALMVLGILWNIANIAWQWYFIGQFMPEMTADAVTEEFRERFLLMQKAVMAIMTVCVLALSVLFGWIALKLTRPAIRAEFTTGN